MTVPRINLSKTYAQDEHQRVQQNLARAIDSAPLSAPRELDLGYVYMTSTTAGQSQQCIKTINLVSSTSAAARYYNETIPFAGDVAAIVCDCRSTIASVQTVNLYKKAASGVSNAVSVASFTVAPSAMNGYQNYPAGAIAFNAGDVFYATVTYATAVSSTAVASFIKLWVRTSV